MRNSFTRTGFILTLCFFVKTAGAQSFDWWKNNVKWDGVTHWYDYLIVSPAYFGPNALTVPVINNGSIDSLASIGASANVHFSKGDKTQNLSLYGNYVSRDKTVSINAWFVPYEHFSMMQPTKEKRKIYYTSYNQHHAVGDVVVTTSVQLLKKQRHRFQLAIRGGFRFPSGNQAEAARFTDAPGYWIDAGFAKSLGKGNWKLISMTGLLVWQTNSSILRQNDAFLFGSGLEWNKNSLRFQGYVAGYIGYKDNGDKPVLLRLNFEKTKNRVVYLFRFQKGLHDFEYTSFETGALFDLKK